MKRAPTFRALPALLALLGTAACGGAPGSPPVEAPSARPGDGLLTDARLQAVVERQVSRDAAGLIVDLADARADVRARAAFALASVQAPEALDPLRNALGDPDAGVRRDAAFAIGQLGAAEAVPALVDAYGSETDASVRRRILEALGKVKAVAASEALLSLDVAPELEADRTLALAALGAARLVATRAAQDHLLARLDDPDPAVRTSAAYYFGRLPAAGPWAARVSRVREALDGYAAADPAAMYLVQGLGKLGDAADLPRLRTWAVSGGDWRIRANAVAALGATEQDAETREALHRGLEDPSGHVAVAAAQALGRTPPAPSELGRIRAAVEANAERVQVVEPLLALLARMDEREYVFAWIDALDPADALRWGVGMRALGAMPGTEARERLGRAAGSGSERVAGDALGALAARWAQERLDRSTHAFYFRVFSEALRGRSVRAAYGAATALGDSAFVRWGSVDTLGAAWRRMEAPRDLEAMMAVLGSLATIGDAAALPVLSEALGHGHPAMRAAAAEALSSLEGGKVAPPDAAADGRDTQGAGEAGAERQRIDWSRLAALGTAPRLVLETERGRIVVRLVPEEAPHTVHTIARLAEEGRYHGVPFHRVVPNFVAQGGDFTSGDGFGGPGFTITSEFTQVPYLRGVIGMASAGKDTEGSQFFLTHSMQPHLDGGYTAFGWVVEGMDAVDRLLVGDRIERASVEPGS